MNRFVGVCLVLALAGYLALEVRADSGSTVQYDTGYPKTGTNNGEILVKGSCTLATGWTASGGLIVAWLQGSGTIHQQAITVAADGTFAEQAIGGLTSGRAYNVVVQVTIRNGMATEVIATDPSTAKPK